MTVLVRLALDRPVPAETGALWTMVASFVVAPIIATEALWGVVLAAIVLRRRELVGFRLAVGAALVVAGGVLIGLSR